MEQINNRSLTNTTIRKPSSSPTTTTSVCTVNTKSTTLSRSKSTENWENDLDRTKNCFHLISCDSADCWRRVETVWTSRLFEETIEQCTLYHTPYHTLYSPEFPFTRLGGFPIWKLQMPIHNIYDHQALRTIRSSQRLTGVSQTHRQLIE